MRGEQTDPYVHSRLHYRLAPEAANRLGLAVARPDEEAAECYILTRGAKRALSILESREDSAPGRFLWLGDPPGRGKTHFLNYWLASQRRGHASQNERELVSSLDLSAPGAPARIRDDLVAAIARRSSPAYGGSIETPLGFESALDQARLAGIRAITVALDLGHNEAPPFLADLVRIVRASEHPSLTVAAAGLGAAPSQAQVAEIGPCDLAEWLAVAVGRARRLEPSWTECGHFYRGIETAPFTPGEIFPFHPKTLLALGALHKPDSVAELARTAREFLSHHNDPDRLICPYDLFDASPVRHIIEQGLGFGGRAALRRVVAASLEIALEYRPLAMRILRTLVVAHLNEAPPALSPDELWSRIPVPPWVNPDRDSPAERRRVLLELASRAGGAIRIGMDGIAFVGAHRSPPEVTAFNSALPLLKLFDPELLAVGETSEIAVAAARISAVLANLAEEAHRVRNDLERFARASRSPLPLEVKRTLSAFVALTEKGPHGLLEIGGRGPRFRSAQIVVAAYRELTVAAASVPALLAMKNFLKQARLEIGAIDSRRSRRFPTLANECRLLEAELGAMAPYSSGHAALQARFERFRWVLAYRRSRSGLRRTAAAEGFDRSLRPARR